MFCDRGVVGTRLFRGVVTLLDGVPLRLGLGPKKLPELGVSNRALRSRSRPVSERRGGVRGRGEGRDNHLVQNPRARG